MWIWAVVGASAGYLASNLRGLSAPMCVAIGILLGPFAVCLFFVPVPAGTETTQAGCPYCTRPITASTRVCDGCGAILSNRREE